LLVAVPESLLMGLADRVFGGPTGTEDPGLLHDLAGELANLIAGHAKALLHGSPNHFRLGTPKLGGAPPEGTFLVARFVSELGEFAVALRLEG
jgi:hypothetical protein